MLVVVFCCVLVGCIVGHVICQPERRSTMR